MPLDITKTLAQINETYKSRPQQEKRNFLVYGDPAMGKSYGMSTLPKPILCHCFDPSGIPDALVPLIDKGELYVEMFTQEDPDKPSQWAAWEQRFDFLKDNGFFKDGAVKSYVLDSLTSLGDYCFNMVFSKSGKKIGDDLRRLYMVQQHELNMKLMQILGLPVTVYMTGHLKREKDEETGAVYTGLTFSDKMNQKIFSKFEEVYVATTQNTPQGPTFRLLTRSIGNLKARTVMGSGKFDQYEDFDITALIEKSKLPPQPKKENKPTLKPVSTQVKP